MPVQVTLTFNVPTQTEIDDFVVYLGWTATVPDPQDRTKMISNPVSKAQFAKQAVINYVRECIKAKRASDAEKTAREVQVDAVNALIIS